ncbi:MAG: hypothetical protein PHU25_21610, partial [Deltaproteobacteria bacterium]|nr:hypothetical protein [Deltaproteobacteria bacterium]
MRLMEPRQALSRWSGNLFAVAILAAALLFGTSLMAQTPAPPPPAPPAAQPAPPAGAKPAPPVVAPAPAPAAAQPATAVDPAKEREVQESLGSGREALKNLDLASAQMSLEQAFAKCDQYGIKGPLQARVLMALGTLFAGYLGQLPQGTEFMKMALEIDATVQPDAELANAQVTSTFAMVRERLGIQGPAAPVTTNAAQPAANAFWVMKHEKITQAKRMFPLGIYVETNPMVSIRGARLYFRMPSDRTFQVADMQKKDNLFGLLIGCEAIALLDPEAMFYYVEVVGMDGSIIAREGSVSQPIEIKMVPVAQFKGVQPNLPGMRDPEQCNPDEAAPCPPWEPHCKDIPCASSEDCVGGKICREGYCVEGEGSGKGTSANAPIGIYISAGIGTGAGITTGTELGAGSGTFEDCTEKTVCEDADLATGFSPTWMFTRASIGYFFLDNLAGGVFVRFQHISSQSMKIAGLGLGEPYDLGP